MQWSWGSIWLHLHPSRSLSVLTLHFFSRVALNLNNLILTRLLTQIGNGFEAVQLWSDHKDVFSLLGVKRICMCVCPENVAPLAITMVTNGRSSQYTLYYHLSLSPTHTHTLYLVKFLTPPGAYKLSFFLFAWEQPCKKCSLQPKWTMHNSILLNTNLVLNHLIKSEYWRIRIRV